ncbi:hypothetical protein ACFV2H_11685 [Streptomyces sp. NPDC059629]|uniref:hypothetical protein n=1 Tax=Streptomyces sp. NPDC059629 TaxID=3346889 RepID=UPI0036A7E2D9
MRVIAAGLAVAGLLAASACTAAQPPRASAAGSSPTAAERPAPASPGAPAGTSPLTAGQAQSALISEADLGVPWTASESTATWHDGLLKAAAGQPGCQTLLDALYAEELLEPAGPHAVTALDDGDDGAQLRYQVVASHSADVDRTLTWLRSLPGSCGQFAAQTTRAGVETVQVADAGLPPLGDARQGLRVVLTGQRPANGDDPTTLTLEVAVVRVGDDAIVLTAGALGTLPARTTEQALDLGVRRLAQVREQGRAQA